MEALKINDIKKSTYQLHVSIFVQKQIFGLIKRMEIQVCSLVPQQWQCCNVFLGFEITDPKVDSSLELRWIDFSWLCDWSRKGPPSFSRASRSFGCFTLSSHWLFTKFSLALIGSCRYLGIDLKIRNRKALQRIFTE